MAKPPPIATAETASYLKPAIGQAESTSNAEWLNGRLKQPIRQVSRANQSFIARLACPTTTDVLGDSLRGRLEFIIEYKVYEFYLIWRRMRRNIVDIIFRCPRR